MSRSRPKAACAVAVVSLLALVAGCAAPPPARPSHRVWHPAHYRWDGARWILVPGHAVWTP